MQTRGSPRLLKSLWDAFRRFGAANGALWIAGQTLDALSGGRWRIQRYYFVAQPVPGSTPAASPAAGPIAVRWIDPHDPVVARFPRPRAVIERRFAMGAQCVVAERRGEFVGFLWLKERSYPEDDVRCEYVLEPGEAAFDFDVYVVPAYRVGRTFSRLWRHANTWLLEHGYSWTISRISAFKPESLAAHRRLGAQRIGSAIFLCMGDKQLSIFDAAPFVHFGRSEAEIPMRRLRSPLKAVC